MVKVNLGRGEFRETTVVYITKLTETSFARDRRYAPPHTRWTGWTGLGVEVFQLLAGRDFARTRTPSGDRSTVQLRLFAAQMANYCYT